MEQAGSSFAFGESKRVDQSVFQSLVLVGSRRVAVLVGSRRVADQSRGCILIEGSEDVIVFRLVGRDATKAKLCLGLRKPNLRLRGPKGW